MKYLYIKLDKETIITFKSAIIDNVNGVYQVVFNGTLGIFKEVNTKTEAEEIINKIHTYLMSDEPSKRVLDLS